MSTRWRNLNKVLSIKNQDIKGKVNQVKYALEYFREVREALDDGIHQIVAGFYKKVLKGKSTDSLEVKTSKVREFINEVMPKYRDVVRRGTLSGNLYLQLNRIMSQMNLVALSKGERISYPLSRLDRVTFKNLGLNVQDYRALDDVSPSHDGTGAVCPRVKIGLDGKRKLKLPLFLSPIQSLILDPEEMKNKNETEEKI